LPFDARGRLPREVVLINDLDCARLDLARLDLARLDLARLDLARLDLARLGNVYTFTLAA
jgi:hypothetical protein